MADFIGTSGDDSLPGTSDVDFFNMIQGGDDTVAAGDGNDEVAIGATLTAADNLDGGDGFGDALDISGDYSAKLAFAATTMTGFENLELGAGGDYNLALDDGNVAAGAQLSVDASFLGADDLLLFNAAHETDGQLLINFGLGRAKVVLGAGDDTLNFFPGVMNAGDRLNGGGGGDRIILSGAQQTAYDFGKHAMRNVETLDLANAFDFDITFADQVIAKHIVFVVSGSSGASLAFHDTGETNGRVSLTGTSGADLIDLGAGDDSAFASAGSDTLSGGGGRDTLQGGSGQDLITGGSGADWLQGDDDADTFVYTAIADSTKDAADRILDLQAADVIDLSAIDANAHKTGDQAFKLVSHFSGHAGELLMKFDAGQSLTYLQGDVDGDGKADLYVTLIGDQSGFDNFVL